MTQIPQIGLLFSHLRHLRNLRIVRPFGLLIISALGMGHWEMALTFEHAHPILKT